MYVVRHYYISYHTMAFVIKMTKPLVNKVIAISNIKKRQPFVISKAAKEKPTSEQLLIFTLIFENLGGLKAAPIPDCCVFYLNLFPAKGSLLTIVASHTCTSASLTYPHFLATMHSIIELYIKDQLYEQRKNSPLALWLR